MKVHPNVGAKNGGNFPEIAMAWHAYPNRKLVSVDQSKAAAGGDDHCLEYSNTPPKYMPAELLN